MSIRSFLQSLRRVTSKGNFIPEIDGLRFLAILPVVIMHANTNYTRTFDDKLHVKSTWYNNLVHQGDKGVWIFFAISGFILSYAFAKHFYIRDLSVAQFDLKGYFIRRLTRLEPPYIISTFILFFFTGLVLTQNFSTLWGNLAATLTYTHNVAYGKWSPINPVTWSLEVEVQFYILAPFLSAIFFRLGENTRNLLLLSLILATPYFVLFEESPFIVNPHLKRLLPVYLPHFLVGLLLASLYTGKYWNLIKGNSLIWDVLGMLSLYLIFTYKPNPKALYLYSVFDMSLLLVMISAFKGRLVNTFFANNVIATIGGMCYSIYLVHYAVIFGLSKVIGKLTFSNAIVNYGFHMLLSLILVISVSVLFFKYCEKPFMYKHWPQDFKEKLYRFFRRNTAL